MTLHVLVEVDHLASRGAAAGTTFGIQGQALDPLSLHRAAEFSLQQRLDQQHQEVHAEQGLDPTHLLQVHRRYHEVGLQVLEPPLDCRLLLVGQQEFSLGHRSVIADQGEDPVAARLFVQPLQLDPVLQREPQLLFADVPGLLPRPAASLLVVLFGDLLLDLNRDPLTDLAVPKQRLDYLDDLGPAVVPGPRRGQLGPQFVQPFERLLQPCQPYLCVQLGLSCAVIPDQPITLSRLPRWLADREAVDQLTLVVVLVVDPSPRDLSAYHGGAEGSVLTARSRQYAEEPAAALMQIGHVLGGSQLAVGDVEEVATASQLAEQLPRALVGAVVGGVTTLDTELHRDGAVAGHGEDVEQLLEVGAVVLVVAPGHRQSQSSSQGPFPLGRLVVAVESDGGRVVVQLVEAHVEFAHGVGRDLQGQRRDVGVEEAVEGPADAIVVERGELSVRQSQQLRLMASRPLTDTVERLARDQQVAQQHEQGRGRGDASPTVFMGQVVAEELAEAEPAQETL